MQTMKLALALALAATAALLLPMAAKAETVRLDTGRLVSMAAHGGGEASPLAIAPDGRPMTALLRIPAGKVLAPHGGDGAALLTVISGTISWGDGDTIDPAREQKFGPGSILLAKGVHWAAARDGDVLAQVVRIFDGSKLAPSVSAQAGQ